MTVEADVTAQGALVPFTSPALAGTRIGLAPDGTLALSPAGGGDPLDWSGLLDHPRITLHDRLLMRKLALVA
ncbi:MAG TPA: hypothetical protein PKZ99_15890, partial [Azospirillaceae bacterium]|nr:hypothetical protein [Azospirillaceae bacterium]